MHTISRKHSLLFEEVTKLRQLKAAWSQIRRNGLQPKSSKETKAAVAQFEQDADKKLRQMQREIRNEKFHFSGNKGVPIKKKDGISVRPLVIPRIEIRILQRSILNILQERKKIKEKYLSINSSFGALKGKGVPHAVNRICELIQDGKSYYVRSDIKNFFTAINLDSVIKTIGLDVSAETDFIKLLKSVTKLELDNIHELKQHGDLFNFEDEGVPQGCCLSPLIANIFLRKFDLNMNNSDMSCIRYLDDFIILGKDHRTTESGFRKAKTILSPLGLEVHDPEKAANKDKAAKGQVKFGFNFLGLDFNLNENKITPSLKNQEALKSGIHSLLSKSLNEMKKIESLDPKHSMVKTLGYASNKIKGWGNSFSKACGKYTDPVLLESIDTQIDKIIFKYLNKVNEIIKKNNSTESNKKKIIGIHSLSKSLLD